MNRQAQYFPKFNILKESYTFDKSVNNTSFNAYSGYTFWRKFGSLFRSIPERPEYLFDVCYDHTVQED